MGKVIKGGGALLQRIADRPGLLVELVETGCGVPGQGALRPVPCKGDRRIKYGGVWRLGIVGRRNRAQCGARAERRELSPVVEGRR